MNYALNKELMQKTFSMGDSYDSFTHRSAQRIKVLPFYTNNATVISLSTVVGEWLRLIRGTNAGCEPLDVVLSRIAENIYADPDEKNTAINVIRTLFWDEQGNIRPDSVDFMCYIPCDEYSEIRIAQYLCSVLGNHEIIKETMSDATQKARKQANVLELMVLNTLKISDAQPKTIEPYYVVHTAPQKTFLDDLYFIVENPVRTKEYLVDLLEFYFFFYTAQTSLALSMFEYGKRDEVIPLYFSLDWEKTNKARECYTSGWQRLQPSLEQHFYHAVTLELLNQTTSGERFDYIALKEYIEENNAEMEVAEQVQQICTLYRNAIFQISSSSVQTELQNLTRNNQLGPAFAEVHYLYDSVRCQFQDAKRSGANDRYIKHFKSFCRERFLKNRKSNGHMLNITEEFLIFLTKLAIKNEEQMSLNEVFHQFELRGVFLDHPSRDEVVKFYTKLNLIDKKSDSGDAQYVKRIL